MKIKKQIIFSLLFIGAVVVGIFYAVRYPTFFFGKGRKQESTVRFVDRNVSVFVDVASEPYAWSKGLMFVERMAENRGMLFVFPDESKRSFWMKDTLIPLDMLFISRDKKVVTIHKGATPCTTFTCPRYAATADAMYVLEVNAGFVDAHGIEEGDTVEISEQ